MAHTHLITLENQPDFPSEDLTEKNADMLSGYYLEHTDGLDQAAEQLFDHQRDLFSVALQALWLRNVEVPDRPSHYRSFIHGFASYDLIQTLVKQKQYDTGLAMTRTDTLLINSNLPTFVELADKSAFWPFERPNLVRTVTAGGEVRQESDTQLHARAMGAHIAFMLQRPWFDVESTVYGT